MPYTYEFPRPALSVDCVIFGYEVGSQLKVLLIERANKPYQNFWALPGGFVEMEEDLRTAALRELEEETGVHDVYIEQLFTFGAPDRDPRGRVVSVAYYALVNLAAHPAKAASDARNVKWYKVKDLPPLAFDHHEIIEKATSRLMAKVRYQPIGFKLLPEKFTLSQLQQLYQTILGVREINKRNFRNKILKMGVLREVGRQKNVAHRPAILYQFDKEKYDGLLRRGLDFEI